MRTTNVSTFRKELQTNLQKVTDSHEPMIVTRQRGKDVVVLSLEDYNAMNETCYLLSNPANAMHLLQSKVQLEEGFSKQIPLAALTP